MIKVTLTIWVGFVVGALACGTYLVATSPASPLIVDLTVTAVVFAAGALFGSLVTWRALTVIGARTEHVLPSDPVPAA